MSKGHHASRRHSYNRRQHELHERLERSGRGGRLVAVMEWLDENGVSAEPRWPFEATLPAPWAAQRGTH